MILFVAIKWSFAETIPISIKTEVDTTKATIGDRIKLNVHLLYPEGTVFEFPEVKKSLGDFEVISSSLSKPKKISGGYEQDWTLSLAVFDTGRISIPALEIKARLPEDTTKILAFQTDSPIVEVFSVLPPGTVEPRDIKPPFPIRRLIPWDIIIFLLLLLVIIVFGVFYYRRWKRLHPVVVINEKFLEPPHIIAFRRLNNLKEKNYSSPDDQKEYYSALSEILREYLERRYYIHALEMTTDEIFESFRSLGVGDRCVEEFNSVFQKSDLVKFAKYVPPLNEIPIDLVQAHSCVEMTKREPFLNRRMM